ncbi:hypothetical protein Ae201684P_003873 [Aphanomyces euteiches]|uniref:RxLR effector protein n=1 Tax=Aphanomyces euteiches TaxID=100861 RepID=A0A6G0XTA5_9STRA|nr:hypothetical protein Ae201684_001759 [Aphanomyces euteiches]KAH9075189.1 hypothetical protein Ae201684P_003873 [Aphanomyces euteiches]KAH9140590.1 hypothetical protein AeRB84_015183 [Aphanomyces euteiches]
MQISLILIALVAIVSTVDATKKTTLRQFRTFGNAALAPKLMGPSKWRKAGGEFAQNLAQGYAESKLDTRTVAPPIGRFPRPRSFSVYKKPAPKNAIQKLASERRWGKF